MSQFWSDTVHRLTPYVPGEQPKQQTFIKLNTNENPYGPSPKVTQAIQAEVHEKLKLYPDPNADALKTVIADYYAVSKEQVFVGNGSDEVLAHAFQALLKHDKPLLFPDITYSFYPVYCGLYDIEYETVALNDSLEINVADYQRDCGAIIFPNPNAPTGRLLALAEIKKLATAKPNCVIVVDEAYIDFGGKSAIPLTQEFTNILVVQTLSKSRSLAGLRVGFAIGSPELVEGLERVKNSFNSYPLDRLAIAGATVSFHDERYFQQTRKSIMESRESLSLQLTKLGFDVIPSAANFVFVQHQEHDAAWLAGQLREKGILIRHFKLPRIENYLRITIGTSAECAALVAALTAILGA